VHENTALPQQTEEVQALRVRVLVLGRPLTRAALLPPIVMALKEQLVDQADCACIKQPGYQIKLCPLHIHLHHHIVLLRQPLSKVKCRDTPDSSARDLLAGNGADAAHATAIGLNLFLLSGVEFECHVLDPGRVRKQRDTSLRCILWVERRVGLNGKNLECVVLLRVLLAEPAADTSTYTYWRLKLGYVLY
jgi:hypothetical protein